MSSPEAKKRRGPPVAHCGRKVCGAVIPAGKITCVVCGAVSFGRSVEEAARPDDGIVRLSEIEAKRVERIKTGLADRNWGPMGDEGICVTSLTLIGGAPGCGKSTLCAQLLSLIAKATGKPTLYVGAEESGEQVKGRAVRLGFDNLDQMLILPLEAQHAGYKITPETFERWKPGAYVIDSVQTFSDSDNDSVKLCEDLKEITLKHRCPGIIISQVNKEEEFSGLNGLKHAVDALMLFTLTDVIIDERGREHLPPNDPETPNEPWRVLKTDKNRDGTAHEAYFSMHGTGLRPFVVPGAKSKPKKEEART